MIKLACSNYVTGLDQLTQCTLMSGHVEFDVVIYQDLPEREGVVKGYYWLPAGKCRLQSVQLHSCGTLFCDLCLL